MVKDYTRRVTHKDYGKGELGLKNYYHKVNKIISNRPKDRTKESIEKGGVFNFASDEFIIVPDTSNGLPFILGGGALFSFA